jgi:formate hydrogenlyase subunit 6/NADH:ubiquinone oxidoreductase subunit I
MPWISEEQCVGCGICEQKCPAGAISMQDGVAVLDMNGCIRCGICHDVCPRSAIRHDSELIPREIKANLERAEWSMSECERLLGSADERSRCLVRLLKHFNKEKKVIEETLGELEKLKQA